MTRRSLAASIVLLGTPIILTVWRILAAAIPPDAAADFAAATDGSVPWYVAMLEDVSWIAWIAPLAMLVSASLVLLSSARIPHPSPLRLVLVLAFELILLLLTWRWMGARIRDDGEHARAAHVSFAHRPG